MTICFEEKIFFSLINFQRIFVVCNFNRTHFYIKNNKTITIFSNKMIIINHDYFLPYLEIFVTFVDDNDSGASDGKYLTIFTASVAASFVSSLNNVLWFLININESHDNLLFLKCSELFFIKLTSLLWLWLMLATVNAENGFCCDDDVGVNSPEHDNVMHNMDQCCSM